MKKLTKIEAIHKLWERGELSWKLKGKQKDVYDFIKNDPNDTSCVLISRRFGKSFSNCILATETCIKIPNAIVKYACPQKRMVKTIIKPIMRTIFEDAPEQYDLNEMWNESDKVYRFPNGSEIQLAGTDAGNAENLRGGYSHLCICDEAGFMDDLDYVINNILLPTTDTTDGRLILTSTPNYKDPKHEFHEMFVNPLEAEGRLVKYTLYDSPMVDEAKIKKIISRYVGGTENLKFRCEYMCEIPKVTENTICSEFSTFKEDILIDSYEMPPHRDFYTSMDVGFRDLTAVLFAYYDFREATLVVMDELILDGPAMTTEVLANELKLLETDLFYDHEFNEKVDPYLRVSDNDLKLINDLHKLHDLFFIATEKTKKEAHVNNMRIWFANGRIRIHERCKHLIYHLEYGQWDKNRREFKRLKDLKETGIKGGHVDTIDALSYLIRNIEESHNPYPDDYNELKGPNIFARRDKESKLQSFMNSIMNRKK